jgi:hypothetical protein
MTNITAPIQCRPWLEDEIARLDWEIAEKQREIEILEEGVASLADERADLIGQLERLDQLYDSFQRDGRVVVDE